MTSSTDAHGRVLVACCAGYIHAYSILIWRTSPFVMMCTWKAMSRSSSCSQMVGRINTMIYVVLLMLDPYIQHISLFKPNRLCNWFAIVTPRLFRMTTLWETVHLVILDITCLSGRLSLTMITIRCNKSKTSVMLCNATHAALFPCTISKWAVVS